jgi:hypothetical protein
MLDLRCAVVRIRQVHAEARPLHNKALCQPVLSTADHLTLPLLGLVPRTTDT